MKSITKIITALLLAVILVSVSQVTVFAQEATEQTEEATEEAKAPKDDSISAKAIAAALVVGLASFAGAIGMGMAISKSGESISRQPEASGQIRSVMMLGLVFIETVVIYALIIAILLIFVL